MPKSRRQLVGIQYLRGVAALLVVFTHVTFFLPGSSWKFYQGTFGVDIFFVISGFVMWVSSRNSEPRKFIIRRILRVAPLYWTITLYVALVSFDNGISIGMQAPFSELIKSLFFIAFENSGRGNTVAPLLGPGWTLNLEMLFYVIFAVSLFFAFRLRLIVLFATLVAVVLMAFFWPTQSNVANFYAQSIMFEFFAGMVIGVIYLNHKIIAAPIFLFIAVVMGFVVLWYPEPGQNMRFLVYGVPAILLVYSTVGLEGVLKNSPFRFGILLGDASYSIYLTHIPVLTILFLGSFHGLFPQSYVLAWPLGVLVCALSGIVIFWIYERPIVRWTQRIVPKPK